MCNKPYLKGISGNFNSNINTYLESARHLTRKFGNLDK